MEPTVEAGVGPDGGVKPVLDVQAGDVLHGCRDEKRFTQYIEHMRCSSVLGREE